MLLIWGFRSYTRTMAILMMICNVCGNPAAQRIVRVVRKFTFFFIPIFPVSTKSFRVCAFCGGSGQLTNAEADQLEMQARTAQPAGQPQYGIAPSADPASAAGEARPAPAQTDYFGNPLP